jgi:hypothetical protein
MILHVATETTGERDLAPDQKKGPMGVAHAVPRASGTTLCGKPVDGLDDQPQQDWPGGLGAFALCPACETAVRQSSD